ncbi:g9411 [Coccomyxa elongata]
MIAMQHLILLGAIVLTLFSSGSALEANSDIALDLQAGACTAFEIDNLPHKYSYDVELIALTGICGPQNISVSKLYVQDACINKRDNELGIGSIQLPLCNEAHDNGAQICQSVFSNGPSDALLTAGNLTAGQNFDSGNVCANSVTAFVYIKNDCILPARAVINVKTRDYGGKLCLTVAGKTLSGVAIAIIVVVVLLALILFCGLICCCCCCRR